MRVDRWFKRALVVKIVQSECIIAVAMLIEGSVLMALAVKLIATYIVQTVIQLVGLCI